jgi:hypothetical protein
MTRTRWSWISNVLNSDKSSRLVRKVALTKAYTSPPAGNSEDIEAIARAKSTELLDVEG